MSKAEPTRKILRVPKDELGREDRKWQRKGEQQKRRRQQRGK